VHRITSIEVSGPVKTQTTSHVSGSLGRTVIYQAAPWTPGAR